MPNLCKTSLILTSMSLFLLGCTATPPEPQAAESKEPVKPAEPTAHLYQVSKAAMAGANGAMAILIGFNMPAAECESEREAKTAALADDATTIYVCRY